MTDFRRLLRNYNLGLEHFSRLIGAGKSSLVKYEKGDLTLSNKTKAKIELGLHTLEKYDLIAPKYDYSKSFNYWFIVKRHKYDHYKDVQNYDKHFKELFEKEGSN